MKLNDGKPWFRRWVVIGYRPITEEGRLVLSIMTAVCLLSGITILGLGGRSPWTELILAFAFAVVLVGNFIAYWKREDIF